MAQHNASGRPMVAAAMNTRPKQSRTSYSKHDAEIIKSGSSIALAGDNFVDSGFIDASEYEYLADGTNAYRDFVLYESDPPFIDEKASIEPNQGSIYSSIHNSNASHPLDYMSTDFPGHETGDQPRANTRGLAHTENNPTIGPPSLFGGFELVQSGPSPLQQWVITPHRHEEAAYHFKKLAPSTSTAKPPQSSSSNRHRRRKSGKKHSRH